MYNNGAGGGNPTEEPDLLAALVNQADLGSEQLLDEEDFSGLVEMADIGLGEDILVSGDGGVQAYRVPQPVVGSTVEIETSQVPFEAMQLSAGGGEEHDEDHGHGQQQGQPPEQPEQQQVNLTMASDVDMMETSIEEQPPQQEPGTLNQPVIESSPIVQQHSEPPGTLQPTIVTASLATESPAPTATVQSTTIKPTVLTYPRVSIASASTSTPPQLQVIGISSASSSVTSGHQQQQPVYVTTNQLSGGNISYILPHGTQLAGGNRTPTLAVKGVSSASAGNTLVINQPKTVSSSNLKLIQTSKGQQLILAAPYTPPSCSSSGGTSATSTTAAPIAQKSSTIAIKGPVITGSKSIPATVAQGVVASGTAGSGQQLIILSPVKQSPHHTSQAGGGTAKSTPTFALPTAMKMVHLPSGSTTKLQQIAPAPGPSSASSTSVPHLKTTTQRVIAPAPMKPHGVAISGSSVGNKPIQTYVHATGGQKNVQYISFVPSVPGAAHPIANQTQAKLIATSSGGLTKYVPLKPQGSVVAKQITTGTGGQTLKPNLVHLTAAGLAGGSGAQKMLINAPTSSIKIATSLAAMGATKLSATTVTSGAGSSGTGGKATSIWMLPKSTQMIKMEGGGGGGTLSTSGPHGSTALQLQATTKPGGSEMARERAGPSGLAASKYIPIAPNPTQVGAMKIEESKTTHLGGTHVMKLNLLPNPDPTEEARRKPCNCTRSQCLKLYCDCFANGEFCHNCNCVSCCNNLAHEETRQKAIRLCLDRNPNAFHPKIGQQAAHGDVERKHTKGCCCKRSGCLKNYCECYEAKILCSDKCKCVGCKNFEESTERKTLMYLADAAEVRSVQQSYTNKVQIWGPDLKLKLPVKVKSDCHPFNIFTDEILEATASCMLAQAEEGEFENYSEENIEGLILDQFGECLSQILNMATNGSGIEDGDLTDEFEEKPNTASLTTSISEVVKSSEAAAGAERA